MTTAPLPIVESARISKELVISKEGLARWIQNTIEGSMIDGGITKRDIEPGFCEYGVNYQNLTLINEFVIQHAIDAGILKDVVSVETIGEGNSIGLRMVQDLEGATSLPSINVLGATKDATPPLGASQALQQLKKSFSLTQHGITFDSTIFINALKSFSAYWESLRAQMQDIPPEQKTFMHQMIFRQAKKILEPLGMTVELNGSRLTTVINYDKFLEAAQPHLGVDRGIVINRNGDGTANLIVDYRRLVDIAFDKAQLALERYKLTDRVNATPEGPDSVKVAVTIGGLEGFWNGAISKLSDVIEAAIAAQMGESLKHLGTVSDPNKNRGADGSKRS